MRKRQQISLLVWMLAGSVFAAPPGPKLGMPVSDTEIARWDQGIMPDGEGLPMGQGNAPQGAKLYQQHCLTCHGDRGYGGSAEPLAGASMGLQSDYPEQTIGSYWPYATTLFDMIRRSKPMNAPGSLSGQQVYALTAYLLNLNGIVSETTELNATNLATINMPNQTGFIGIAAEDSGAVHLASDACLSSDGHLQ